MCYLSFWPIGSLHIFTSPANRLAIFLKVITGFNTDVEYSGITYHVQTEDKGLARPVLMTLIYDGGTILASKRTPYDDLVADGMDEDVLAERLLKQHRTICAAIKAGRIDDLKKLAEKDSGRLREAEQKAEVTAAAERPMDAFEEMSVPVIPKPEDVSLEMAGTGYSHDSMLSTPIPRPAVKEDFVTAPQGVSVVEDYSVIEEEEIVVPDEAVEIVSEMSGRERPANNKLSIEMLGSSRFRGGDLKTVSFLVCRGNQSKVVQGAQIMIKLLGTGFRPVIFHAETDQNGVASIPVQIPKFTEGRAALLARAVSEGDEVELRRHISQK